MTSSAVRRAERAGRAVGQGGGGEVAAQRKARRPLHDGEGAVREDADQQLVHRGLAEPRAQRELLAREALAREMVPDEARDPTSVVHAGAG
jgi:hypothetical protein